MADKEFGRTIERRRHELGLTQEMVAKKVNVKANYIGYLERGMRHPSQKVVEKLSGALKLDPQELYLLANPKVRTLLGKTKSAGPAPSGSVLQQLLRDPALQEKHGLTSSEKAALTQLAQAEKSASMAGLARALGALRRGFGGS
jgi:transcriptional regulator with XRE-family HTH domain